MECFQIARTVPVEIDSMTSAVINGDSVAMDFFNNHVGSGSEQHWLVGDKLMTAMTSAAFTGSR